MQDKNSRATIQKIPSYIVFCLVYDFSKAYLS